MQCFEIKDIVLLFKAQQQSQAYSKHSEFFVHVYDPVCDYKLYYFKTEIESSKKSSSKISTGAIVGIIIGIVLVAAAAIIIVLG